MKKERNKISNENFRGNRKKERTNIIEQHKKYKEESSNDVMQVKFKSENQRKIGFREMLNIIGKTNKFKGRDLSITFGPIEIFYKYKTGCSGVDYAVIPIYKNDAIRILIEYYFIIFNIINAAIDATFIVQKVYTENRQELEDKFSKVFEKIFAERIYILAESEKREMLKKKGKREIENEKEALELATKIQKRIKIEFSENFTEGLACLMLYDYLKEVEYILEKY